MEIQGQDRQTNQLEITGDFMETNFTHSNKNISSGDFGKVDDAIVNDPRVKVKCVIKELDGQALFLKPSYKDINKNRHKIENEVKFLL